MKQKIKNVKNIFNKNLKMNLFTSLKRNFFSL